MISDAKKIIFIHIRKNAGSFFYSALGEKNELLNNGVLDSSWHEMKKKRPDYRVIAIIRNPWDRFLSGWRYCRSTRDIPIDQLLKWLPSKKPIKDRLLNPRCPRGIKLSVLKEVGYRTVSPGLSLIKQGKVSRFHGYSHDFRHVTIPQTSFLLDKGKFVADAIVRFECLEEDLRKTFCRYEIDAPLLKEVLAPVNTANVKRDYREEFSPATKALFRDNFIEDVTQLGYSFSAGPGVAPSLNKMPRNLRDLVSSSR